MQTVPWVLRGAFRPAIQWVFQEILAGSAANDVVKTWLEGSLVVAKDDFVPNRSGRFRPTHEAGGEDHFLSARFVVREGSHTVSLQEASSTA